MFVEYSVNDRIEFVFPDCTLQYTIKTIGADIVDFNDIEHESYYLYNITNPNCHNEVFNKLKLDPFHFVKELYGDYNVGFIRDGSYQDSQAVPRFLTSSAINRVIKDLKKLTNSKKAECPKNLKVTTSYKLDDEIKIHFPDKSVLIYKVKKCDSSYFLHNMENAYDNDEIFTKMRVKPRDYLERVLGYADLRKITPIYNNPLGVPYSVYCFKTLEDLNKVVADLKRELFAHNPTSFFRQVMEMDKQEQEEQTKFNIKIPKLNINLNFKV